MTAAVPHRRRRLWHWIVVALAMTLAAPAAVLIAPEQARSWLASQDRFTAVHRQTLPLVQWADRLHGQRAGEPGAIEAGLRWLHRQQQPDGRIAHPGASQDQAIRSTAIAMAAFLGAGYDHRTPNRFTDTVAKGLSWLRGQVSDPGTLAARDLGSLAWVAIACCEAYAMTNDPALREPCQAQLDTLSRLQHPEGWWAGGDESTGFASDTCQLMVMALKSGKAAGLDTAKGLREAQLWLTTQLGIPSVELVNDGFPRHPGDPDGRGTPAAAAMAVYLGWRSGPTLDALEGALLQGDWDDLQDPWHAYQVSLFRFHYGGEAWAAWQEAYQPAIAILQHRGNPDIDGSWSPSGPPVYAEGTVADRFSCTALRVLGLEFYYRRWSSNAGGQWQPHNP